MDDDEKKAEQKAYSRKYYLKKRNKQKAYGREYYYKKLREKKLKEDKPIIVNWNIEILI